MASGFRDSEGILLVEFLKRGATVNPERAVCAADIKEVKKKRIPRFRPNRKLNQVLMNIDEVTHFCMFLRRSPKLCRNRPINVRIRMYKLRTVSCI